MTVKPSRRGFLGSLSAIAAGATLPACRRHRGGGSSSGPPSIPLPPVVQSGDVTHNSAIVWGRSSRHSRMVVEWSEDGMFNSDLKIVMGPEVTASTDFTGRVELTGLPPGKSVPYRVTFREVEPAPSGQPSTTRTAAAPKPSASVATPEKSPLPVAKGVVNTAPIEAVDVVFAWSSNTAGQGYGIDFERGGYPVYRMLQEKNPQFFIHAGDLICADVPIKPELVLPDGTKWKNVVTKATDKAAESLAEFRGRFAYNFQDASFRAFLANCPMFVQWNDREVRDDWYPGQVLDAASGYGERNINVLAERSRRALFEWTAARDSKRTYRSFSWGPQADFFLLDGRSARNANGANLEDAAGSGIFGRAQLDWLKQGLVSSKGVWKFISSAQSWATIVPSPNGSQDGFGNQHGQPQGREHELAELLKFIRDEKVKNVVVLAGGAQYPAVHHYIPMRAHFQEFRPFWEFLAGPMHGGVNELSDLDGTFGADLMWSDAAVKGQKNIPPSSGKNNFGLVKIAKDSNMLMVTFHNGSARPHYVNISPEAV